jgi:hypothetical protein
MALLVVFFWHSVLDLGFGLVGSKLSSSSFFGLDHPSWNTLWHFFPSTFLAYPLAWGPCMAGCCIFLGVGLFPPFF